MSSSHAALLWSPGLETQGTGWESPGVHPPSQHADLAGLLIAGNTHEFTFITRQFHFLHVGVWCDKVHVCVLLNEYFLVAQYTIHLADDKYVSKTHVCLLLK